MRVFVDSDVIISSLLSQLGAAHSLITEAKHTLFLSSLSQKELELVCQRLDIKNSDLKKLIQKYFQVTILKSNPKTIQKDFSKYTTDQNDAHIVAGAQASKVNFLVTYNLKDFKIEKIKKDFKIITLTPGNFLQHLRSLR